MESSITHKVARSACVYKYQLVTHLDRMIKQFNITFLSLTVIEYEDSSLSSCKDWSLHTHTTLDKSGTLSRGNRESRASTLTFSIPALAMSRVT